MSNLEKQKIRWEKQKAKGKTRYVLFHVLLWMVYAAILATMNILIFDRAYLNHINKIVIAYVIFMVILGLVGVVVGNISWRANAKKYKN